MNRRTKYPPELRERAIRMVYEQREHHESQWAAIESVAQKIGCTAQTLRNWIAKTEGKAVHRVLEALWSRQRAVGWGLPAPWAEALVNNQ